MAETLVFLLFMVLLVTAYYWSQGDTKKRIAKLKQQNSNVRKNVKKKSSHYNKELRRPKYR